jgi:Skp family chaperone for outer membrane proteins
MNTKGKASGVIFVLIILVLLLLAATGFYLYNQEHIKNINLEERIEELNAKYKIGEAKLLEAQKVLASLEEKLKESDNRIAELRGELEEERAAKESVFSDLEQINSDLEEQKELRSKLELELEKATNELRLTQDRLVSLESEKRDLEAEAIDKDVSGVELGKIVVKDDIAVKAEDQKVSSSSPQLEGKILVLNKEYDFAVINLGSRDGVALGQLFSIYRGENYLGDIKVEKLHDSMAAAGFLVEGVKNKVREGDRVVKKA